MSNQVSKQKLIINALIWAVMILVSSYVIEDKKAAAIMLYALIGGYVATSSMHTNAGNKCASLWRKITGKSASSDT